MRSHHMDHILSCWCQPHSPPREKKQDSSWEEQVVPPALFTLGCHVFQINSYHGHRPPPFFRPPQAVVCLHHQLPCLSGSGERYFLPPPPPLRLHRSSLPPTTCSLPFGACTGEVFLSGFAGLFFFPVKIKLITKAAQAVEPPAL